VAACRAKAEAGWDFGGCAAGSASLAIGVLAAAVQPACADDAAPPSDAAPDKASKDTHNSVTIFGPKLSANAER